MSHHYALFSAHYHPHKGGIESFTQGLADQLALEGDTVDVVTMRLSESDKLMEVQENGVTVWRLPSRPLMGGRLPIPHRTTDYQRLMNELLQRGITRVLVNARFYPHSIDGLRFAQKIDAPAVLLDHGSEYLTLGNPLADAAIIAHEHIITKRGKKYSPTYAGISQKSTEHLRKFGIQSTHVINNALDSDGFKNGASKRNFRDEFGINGNQHLVAFTGRLTPEKGALELAAAAKLLGDDYVFALAGDGFLRAKLEEQQLPHLHLLGMVSREDLSALLSQSDCFCLPTRSEGFCTSLLESSAWGLPAVIPDVGGVREVLGAPPKLGVILQNRSAPTIAEGIQRAVEQSQNTALRQSLSEHVAMACSWAASTSSLRKIFDNNDNC
ncbi:MAG: glycosyltransferase family 4 protein [Atopobiaceae bacterium]|nr:glycosyltransferase family 4 protein [Atopobiaceae bacterium]